MMKHGNDNNIDIMDNNWKIYAIYPHSNDLLYYKSEPRFGMIEIVHESYTGIWEFHI